MKHLITLLSTLLAICAFHCCKPVESIKLEQDHYDLFVDDEITLSAKLVPLDAADKRVVWSSTSRIVSIKTPSGRPIEDVETKDLDVVVKAVGSGEAAITVKAVGEDYHSATCVVSVKQFDAKVKSSDVIKPGCKTVKLAANIEAYESKDLISVIVEYGKDKGNLSERTSDDDCFKNSDYSYSHTINLSGLEDGVTYYYRVVAIGGKQRSTGNVQSFYTLPIGAIDLDLPSGHLWRSANVGSEEDEPLDYGNYYAWGDTKGGRNQYDWTSYKWSDGSYNKLTKYCFYSNNGQEGYVDNLAELEPTDDVASIELGEQWRIPSIANFNELLDKCIWTDFNSAEIRGKIVSSKKDEMNPKKRIFIPFPGMINGSLSLYKEITGFYWTRNLYTDSSYDPCSANVARISYDNNRFITNMYRCYGASVRPVTNK